MTITQQKAQQYILDSITPENYNVVCKNDEGKLYFLRNTFLKEQGYMIDRIGFQQAFVGWLQGLPSAIDIIFYNEDILKLAREWGALEENASKAKEERFINGYWNVLASNAMQLFKKYKIN